MASTNHDVTPSGHSFGWPLLLILAIGVASLAGAWFTFAEPLNESKSKPTLRYIEAVVGEPSRVNPLFAHLNDADRDLVSLTFSGLTRLGAGSEVLPDLAEKWEISEDGKIINFRLRSGVTWHDGSEFTSADVVFTYNLLRDPDLQGDPDQAALWRQVKCEAPAKLLVACRLPAPFAPFLAYAAIGILPKNPLKGVTGKAMFDSPFNQAPVGTGPFRLAQLDEEHAVLVRHGKYHLSQPDVADPSPARSTDLIGEIDLVFFPDIPSAAAAVVRGEAQGILLDSSAGQDDFETISSLARIKSYSANRSAYTALYLNNNSPPLNEAPVRRAIALAIDLDAIIDSGLGGRAQKAGTPIAPGSWAFNGDLEPPKQDLAQARTLLEEEGWLISDGSEARFRNDIELAISIITDRDPLRAFIARAISEQLAEIGLKVTVEQQDSATLISDFLAPREYEAAVFGFDSGADPDPYPAWHSSQAAGNGRNLAGYSDEEADALMENARTTDDLDERQRLYFTFQQLFRDDIPSIILYYPAYTYFATEQVEGVQLGVLVYESSRFRNAHEWSFSAAPDLRAP